MKKSILFLDWIFPTRSCFKTFFINEQVSIFKCNFSNDFSPNKSRESEISFVTTNPFEIYSDYEVDLNDETIKELEVKRPEDVVILTIITLGRTLESSTMNLKAPLVINIKNNLGKQYIMQNSKYETKHPLIRRD